MKKLILSFVLLTGLQVQAKALDCVNVYFDRSTDPTYWMGKTYTTLSNEIANDGQKTDIYPLADRAFADEIGEKYRTKCAPIAQGRRDRNGDTSNRCDARIECSSAGSR